MSTVDRDEVLAYLLSRGVPENHAHGMIANIQAESGFRPTINEQAPLVPGSRGGYGLFQHTGPRRRALEAQPNYQEWRTQVDFALSEPESKKYLAQSFKTPADASMWFTKHWERPANAEQKARERLKYLPGAPGVDVRMASTDNEIPRQMRVPGDPVTGRAPIAEDTYGGLSGGGIPGDPRTGRVPQMQPQQAQQMNYQDMMPPQRQEPDTWQGRLEQALSSPLMSFGIGMLTAPGNYGDFGSALGYGLRAAQGAVHQQSLADQQLWELQQRRQDTMMKRQMEQTAQNQTRMLADQLRAAGMNNEAALFERGLLSKEDIAGLFGIERPQDPTEYGTGMNIIQGEDGKYYAARLGKDGSMRMDEIPGTPWQVEGQSPEMLQRRAAATAAGKGAVEEQMAVQDALGRGVQQGMETISRVDDLLNDPALDSATGLAGPLLRNIPNTAAANWDVKLERLKSGLFMQAFETLKGGGQITEKEGQAALNSLIAIDPWKMDAENVRAELKRVRDWVEKNMKAMEEKAAKGDQRALWALQGAYLPGMDTGAPTGRETPQGAAEGVSGGAGGGMPDFSSMSDEELDAFIGSGGAF